MSELDRLRDRVAELEDAMGLTAELPRELVPRALVSPELKGGRYDNPGTLRFINILLVRPFGDREAIFAALYGHRHEDEQPNIKILDIYKCAAHKVLKAHGVEIETIWGRGWRIDPANKAKLRTVIEKLNHEQQQAA